jgi:hypothetical protein
LADNQIVKEMSFKSITLGSQICVNKIGEIGLVVTTARLSEKDFAGTVGHCDDGTVTL